MWSPLAEWGTLVRSEAWAIDVARGTTGALLSNTAIREPAEE